LPKQVTEKILFLLRKLAPVSAPPSGGEVFHPKKSSNGGGLQQVIIANQKKHPEQFSTFLSTPVHERTRHFCPTQCPGRHLHAGHLGVFTLFDLNQRGAADANRSRRQVINY
jgi:hypothetical protein